MNEVTQPQVEQALQRMQAAAEQPRALAIRPEDRAALHQAIQRAHAQLLGQADAVITIALAGCTGSGKSTLINALAGSRIAGVSERRPCTTQTRVYHHAEVPSGGLPEDLAEQATFIAHGRPELRQKVIVDTPDLDTFYTEHRAATRALLKAAGLVIYVFSPERYVEERAWSVIREEQRFSACLAVLNKSDTVAPDVLQRIAGEIRQRFAEMGKPDIPVLCISAARHVSATDAEAADAPETVTPRPAAGSTPILDEFLTLRAYIEHEIQAGDIAQMLRRQRLAVVDHLESQVNRLIPADAAARLDQLADTARDRARTASDGLADYLAHRLAAMEADLWPLIVVRKHQRFWGPFRTWLAVSDFLRYGLPRLIRQLRLLTLPAGEGTPGQLITADRAETVTDRLRNEARHLQTTCFESGLPVERWRAITSDIDGSQFLTSVARDVEARFEALAAAAYSRGRALPWLISFIAWLMPAGLVIFTAYTFVTQYVEGRSGGMNLVWDLVAMLILSYLLLHILTGLLMSGRGILPQRSISRQALDEAVRGTVDAWVKAYRSDVEADIADLREPLALLRDAAQGRIVRTALPAPAATEPQESASSQATPAQLPTPAELPADTACEQPSAAPSRSQAPVSAAELLRQSMQTRRKGSVQD